VVLDPNKAGPEDVRTAPQRRHDALEEACRRLAGAGCVPDRAGQPTQVQLHLTLGQLRDLPGAEEAEAALARRPGGPGRRSRPARLAGRAAQGYACDAAITPILTGHLDPVHHLQPRATGGQTRLRDLVLLCAFHHLIAVHQWGWTLTLNTGGTTTAISPDHNRTLHSHGPPTRAA
jgi:Domain of unknown function (DUF222)